jgi:pilus assembly protein CpaC
VNSLTTTKAPPDKQIMLKVRFAEVDRTKLDSLGINILSTGAANTIGTVTTQQFGTLGLGESGRLTSRIPGSNRGFTSSMTISDLLNVFLFRPDLNLGATIRDLQQKNVLQILAEPNLMAMNGETAQFLAGGEFPYPLVQSSGGLSAVTIQFRQFGVKLEFTGTIDRDNVIRLKVTPEVSALDYANAVTISGFLLPAISTRRAQTQVELRDGQSFGIAGMLDQRTTAQFSKMPGIGDVPILGQLFRSKSINRTGTELVVLVTPTIVDPLSGPAPATTLPRIPLPLLNNPTFDKGLPKGQSTVPTPGA